MASITDKLNILINSLREKGITEVDNLLPGLSRQEIEQNTSHLPFKLPEEIYELYQWRNGCDHNFAPSLFRDQKLLTLDDALKEYEYLIEGYIYESDEDDIDIYQVDLKSCFPFAGFDGSIYTISCGKQYFTDKSKLPIISVFEGIDLYFYTFDSMLDTCIEWVQHPSYRKYYAPLNQTEAWEKNQYGSLKGERGKGKGVKIRLTVGNIFPFFAYPNRIGRKITPEFLIASKELMSL